MKCALVLYPHQLYDVERFPEVERVFLVEEPLYFGIDQQYPRKFHKQKLILHRASMRRYVEEVLWPAGFDVEYIDADTFYNTADILDRVKPFEKAYFFDPVDDLLTRRLLLARRDNPEAPPIEFLPNPNFYLSDTEIRQFFSGRGKHGFQSFYQWQRERFNILIDSNYKPLGGKWSFDKEKRKKLPDEITLPNFQAFGDNKFVRDATHYVEDHFPDNPGSTDFVWPTNRQEALDWLHDFVEKRLDNFGPYQDAINSEAPWLYHSALSSSLNIGLLSPQEVITAALRRHSKQPVPLSSLEAFIQQILGRREYMRGLYMHQPEVLRTSNVFQHKRRIKEEWYTGDLGIPPFDDLVRKLQARAYAHHNERLMVAGNLMILCEVEPSDIYEWFTGLFIDAYDWSLAPSVYSLSQFADSGRETTKPCVSASNYILDMSDYERGDWCDIWDGLYWRFIDKNRRQLSHNPSLRAVVQRLDRLDPDRKRIINYRAEDFLARATR